MFRMCLVAFLGFLLLGNGLPPKPPQQYSMPTSSARVWFVPLPHVQPTCILHGAAPPIQEKAIIMACYIAKLNLIVMPDPCIFKGEYYAALQCHENGHIHGWRHIVIVPETTKERKDAN